MFLRFPDRAPGDCKVRDKPAEFEHYSAPPPPPMTGADPDCRHRAAAATLSHRPTSISLDLTETAPPQPEDHSHTDSGPWRKPPALENPLPPPRCPEVDSHESSAGSQSEGLNLSDHNSAFNHTHAVKGDSEQGKGQGAGHHLSAFPSASSYRPSGLASMEGHRSPSPQFSPQRLSDRPPVSLQDEFSNR